MILNFRTIPFYIEFTIKLIMIICLCVIITYGQSLVIPIAFSILLSILLLPLNNFLENKVRLPKSIAIMISIVLVLCIVGGIIYFLSYQISGFITEIPVIKQRLLEHYATLQTWINDKFNITSQQQTVLINKASDDVTNTGKLAIGETFFTITQLLFEFIIISIFSFLLLSYRHTIKIFLVAVFKKEHNSAVNTVLEESKVIVQSYMLGLIIEMGIIAIANTTILLIIGVKYAIFLGVFSAIFNIIPYVGILIGIAFSCIITLTTSTHLSDILWIIIGFEIIHFIDSNFLMPLIVGSKVKINALITIVGVVVGGMLLGLSGIFLALPFIAILKIIFDKVDGLKPWGLLMGDSAALKPKSKLQKHIEKRLVGKIKTTNNTTY